MANPLPVSFAREMPLVWRADELARPVGAVVASGHAALDAQLPAGGWPVGGLVEVLQAQSPSQNGQHANRHDEWRLLLPALARTRGTVLLVGAPYQPFGPGLAAQGLDPQRLLCVTAQTTAQRLWACEQALRCADVTAVLAWLPQGGSGQVRPEQLRRLQMAASTHSKLLFVMRPLAAREESSPATLRVLVSGQENGQVNGQDRLALHILKRRGPPLEQPLSLPARAARLAALLAVTRRQVAAPPVMSEKVGDDESHEASHDTFIAQITPFPGVNSHALDRTAAAA